MYARAYKTMAIPAQKIESNGFAGGCWPSQGGLSVLSFCQRGMAVAQR